MTKKTLMATVVAAMFGGFAAQACYCPSNGGDREYSYYDYYDCADTFLAEQIGLLPGGSSFRAIRSAQIAILTHIFFGGDPSAGDIFDNPSLDLTYSYTDFESDSLGADGDANALTLSISGNHGDNMIGIGFTYDRVETDGFADAETMTADLYYGFQISENFYAGLMGTVSFIEAGAAADDHQWGLGPFVAASLDINDTFSVGGTAAVMRYEAVADSVYLINLLGDVSAAFTDVCGASAYVGYTDAADDDIDFEEYFTVGIDVSYQVNDTFGVHAAYETTLGHDDVDDDTFVLGGTLTF